MRRGKPNKKQQKPWPNVGSTVAALAAVLAAAPTAVQSPAERQRYLDSRQHDRPGLLAVPSPGGGPGSVSPRSACSSPALPSARRPLCSPGSLSAAPSPAMAPSPGSAPAPSSTSPLQSLRHEFRSFKRRSISEISLVLELVRGVARARWAFDEEEDEDEEELDADSDPEGPAGSGGRRFYTLSPAESQGNSLFGGGGGGSGGFHRGGAQSTGNLLSRQGTQRRRQALRRKIQWEQLSPAAIQRHLVQVQEEKAMLQAPTAPIDAPKFVAYVQERRKKRILFKGEFLMIQRSVDPQKVGTEVAIRMGDKNQYPDTLPYDHNRVVLEPRAGIDDSHYINASYVNSWLREKAYVVTQSVRNKQASNELWRCIWELGSNTIVMLTKIFDFMRVVCLQYWPQTQFQFGEIHVETLETRTYAHFVIRTFRLRKTGGLGELAAAQQDQQGNPIEERIVKHFHFTEWELNSFPYISAFVELRRRVRQWTEKNPVDGPIVVHCSNGGGRSGAFLAVDASLELLQRTGQLDVYEYGRTMANARQHLISSVEQYMFIYDVLCEAVLCNLQPMAMHQLKERSSMYKARKDRELMELQDSHENKLLTMLTAPLRIGDCAGGHRLENRGKNRDVMVVPPDHARPYLQTLHGESKDYTYINAVEVDGFTRKAEFIVTEWPKQQTLDSFWTLIFDHNVHTVICLTNQPNDMKVYPPFVHNKGKKNYGPFTIEIVNFQQYPGLCSHMVKISKRPMEEVVERRKWLFSRRRSKAKLRRRPTLSHFLAECEKSRRRDSGPNFGGGTGGRSAAHSDSPASNPAMEDVNFRLQQRYWGRIHRKTPPTPSQESDEDEEESGEESAESSGSGSPSRGSATSGEEKKPPAADLPTREGVDQKEDEELWDELEDENELMGVHRRLSVRRRDQRPVSMVGALPTGAALPDQQAILHSAGAHQNHRPKRDERGRRLAGEWDKRLERREGDGALVARLNERGEVEAKEKQKAREAREDRDDRLEEAKDTKAAELLDKAEVMSSSTAPSRVGGFSQSTKSRRSSKSGGGRGGQLRRSQRRRHRRRLFSEPNLGTLERFEKTFMISEIMATGASQQQLEAEVRLCCIIQVRMWPIENKVPLSTTALIEVLKMTRSWRKRAPDRPESRPTIVMSHNGVSRCGIFIAANVCIDQMEMDHEVDVFHAVKLIRINRPQLIDMKDEYKYLYDLMLHWYMTNPELRSHEPPEVVSLNSEESEEDLLSAGKLTRSGSRRRSIQRSKSSRASRRTQRTANSTTLSPNSNAADATANNKLARNSSSVSAGARIEPVFLN